MPDYPQPLSEEYLEQLKSYAAHHHEYPWSEILLLCNVLHAERERAEKLERKVLYNDQDAQWWYERCQKAEADLQRARGLVLRLGKQIDWSMRDTSETLSDEVEAFLYGTGPLPPPAVPEKEK